MILPPNLSDVALLHEAMPLIADINASLSLSQFIPNIKDESSGEGIKLIDMFLFFFKYILKESALIYNFVFSLERSLRHPTDKIKMERQKIKKRSMC